MSLELLILFATAMIAAVLGRCLSTGALLANAACVGLLALVVLLARIRGLRGPVV